MMTPTHEPNKFEIIISFVLIIIANLLTVAILLYVYSSYSASVFSWMTAYFMTVFLIFMTLQYVFNFIYAIWQRNKK